MAVAHPLPTAEIRDLRSRRGEDLAPLFAEEQRLWREELDWDYRPSVELIRKHVDAHTLPGYVALSRGEVAGYCFFVYEDHKGLIGNLYLREAHRRDRPATAGLAGLLLEQTLETLEHSPTVQRIEAQLIPFGIDSLEPTFRAHQFQCFPRLFLYKALETGLAEVEPPPGARLEAWDDSHFEAMADLIVSAYRGHVDSRINDHYGSRAGALRFLKNIVIFPGCGVFLPDCSWVAIDTRGSKGATVGAVLSSQVAPGVGHITQICLLPEWQGQGLGHSLLRAALARLGARGYRGVSLTVTASNESAVNLYRRLGFTVRKEFGAFARTLP